MSFFLSTSTVNGSRSLKGWEPLNTTIKIDCLRKEGWLSEQNTYFPCNIVFYLDQEICFNNIVCYSCNASNSFGINMEYILWLGSRKRRSSFLLTNWLDCWQSGAAWGEILSSVPGPFSSVTNTARLSMRLTPSDQLSHSLTLSLSLKMSVTGFPQIDSSW